MPVRCPAAERAGTVTMPIQSFSGKISHIVTATPVTAVSSCMVRVGWERFRSSSQEAREVRSLNGPALASSMLGLPKFKVDHFRVSF